jgi:hypothetical protein
MDTKTPNTSADTGSVALDQPGAEKPPANPWEEYVVGKRIPAERFVAKLVKGPIPIPDQQLRDQIAAAIVAKPVRLARLGDLIRASANAGETVRRVATDLVLSIGQLFGLPPLPLDADQVAFRAWIVSWLNNSQKMPLPPAQLNVLLLLLQIGKQRGHVDADSALEFIASAISKPRKKRASRAVPVATQTPLDVVLAAPPTAPALLALIAHSMAWQTLLDDLNEQIRSRDDELSHLKECCSDLESQLSRAREEVIHIQELRSAAEKKINELEKRLVDLGDGWQHRVEEVRGRLRGVMQGQLTRWLRTALDAARSDPPFVNAVQERLEDALRALEGEIQWLQRSD